MIFKIRIEDKTNTILNNFKFYLGHNPNYSYQPLYFDKNQNKFYLKFNSIKYTQEWLDSMKFHLDYKNYNFYIEGNLSEVNIG